VARFVNRMLSNLGIQIVRTDLIHEYGRKSIISDACSRWTKENVPAEIGQFVLQQLATTNSHSQLQQELLALYISKKLKDVDPYFVEFGATDGLRYSNTFYLEQKFGFNGILAEPARISRAHLKENRKCKLDFRCVWEHSGKKVRFVEFDEVEYSGVSGYSSSRYQSKQAKSYLVDTISLLDLLQAHNAPQKISFLSIDTEGSEFDIIKNFPFDQYSFHYIAIEHNYSTKRILIKNLLTDAGYVKILGETSQFDDWYLSCDVYNLIRDLFIP